MQFNYQQNSSNTFNCCSPTKQIPLPALGNSTQKNRKMEALQKISLLGILSTWLFAD